MQNRLMKSLSWIMIFMLLLQWTGVSALPAAQRQAEERLAQKQQAIAKLERLFDALEEVVKEIPRDTFDPQAIVDKVGKDPVALFEWVRDNTYLVPYRGTLRGPIGVLMDRLGNSLDRALLLHELLTIVGYEARLARGTLSTKQAEIMLNTAQPIPPGGPFPVDEDTTQNLDEYIIKQAKKFNLDPDELQKIGRKLTLQQQYMSEELAQRVADQTKAILKLIGEPEIDTRTEERVKAIKALQDHWWVQYKGMSGWNKFDPTLHQVKARESSLKIGETLQPDEIDASLQHLVTIRVLIERLEEGESWEDQVLEYTLRPSKLFGKRIQLKHIPLNWPNDLDLFTSEKPFERLKEVVSMEKEWLPVLTVGSEKIAQSSFTDTGELNKEPGKKTVSPTESIGRGTRSLWGNFMGSLSGSESQIKKKTDSQLTAEWIEYEIRMPGEPTKKIRRNVFSLLKSAERKADINLSFNVNETDRIDRGLSLLGEVEILLQSSNLKPEFVIYLMGSRLLDVREQLIHSLRVADSMENFLKKMEGGTPLPGTNYNFVLMRQQEQNLRNPIYLDRPNIVTFFQNLQTGKEGNLVSTAGMDIISNKVEVVSDSAKQIFRARVQQGVLDTLSENLTVKSIGRMVENTAELFMRSEAHRIEWITLRTINDLRGIKQHLDDDVVERLKTDIESGYILVAPVQAMNFSGIGKFGWWRIDPKNGQTIGIMSDGRGSGLTDYQAIIIHGIPYMTCVIHGVHAGGRLSTLILCTLGFGTGILGHAAGTLPTIFVGKGLVFKTYIVAAIFEVFGAFGVFKW